jgi:tetratricopeptide (TPR) repeat protein
MVMAESIVRRKRIYLAGILLILLISVGFILLVEIGLRMADYGYASDFLIKKKIMGRDVYINNIFYTSKFFTPELIRTPTPLVVDRTKKENTIRIAIAGESAAVGDPDYSFGFARILKIMLQDEYPDKNFEIINTAITAVNSHVILPIVKETSRKLEPDVFLIYMGNNEVIGPFGPNAAFSSYTVNRNLIKLNVAVNSTRLGTLARNTGRALSGKEIPEQWDGMEMFLNYKVAPGDEILDVIHENFRMNLEEMVRFASKKSKVIISNVAVNLSDCPPFFSAPGRGLTESDIINLKQLLEQSEALFTEGSYLKAKEIASKALETDHQYAAAHFLMAKSLQQLNQNKEAEAHFNLALDLDALKFRADNKLNSIIRVVYNNLGEHINVDFLDMVSLMKDSAVYFMPGSEMFLEHVHFNFYGNYLLANFFRQKIKEVLDLPETNEKLQPVDYFKSRLAYTPYEDYKIHREILMRMDRSPFAEQLLIRETKKNIEAIIASIMSDVPRENQYINALQYAENDWMIRYNYALFLMAQGRFDQNALGLLQQIDSMVPQNPTIKFNMGLWYEKNDDFTSAKKLYKAAIEIFPWYRDANKSLAALDLLHKDREIQNVGFKFNKTELFEIYSKSARLSADKGNMARAAELFELAFEIDPANYEVAQALGSIHLNSQSYNKAINILNTHRKFNPECRETHFKLALAYEGMKDFQNALVNFSKTMELNPENLLLLNKIGQMQYLTGNFPDAIATFEKSILLNPNQRLEFAYTNIGMAYSKLGESVKAIQFYRRALEVNPNDQTVLTALTEEYKILGELQQ